MLLPQWLSINFFKISGEEKNIFEISFVIKLKYFYFLPSYCTSIILFMRQDVGMKRSEMNIRARER